MRTDPVGPAVLAVLLGGVACAPEAPPLPPYDPVAHAANVHEWREWRHSELVKPDGWLSLSGLYWLTPGTHRLGSDPENELIYDREGVPPLLGTLRVDSTRVDFLPAIEREVTIAYGGSRGSDDLPRVYWPDSEDPAPLMRWGDVQWYVIVREDHLALRLKDALSPRVVDFAGMPNFDLKPEWRLDATFESYDPARQIKVPNVFGTIGDVESPGAVVFEHDGTEHRIDLWRDSDDPENFFTAFGDETNGFTSYGAGRFLWIDAPDEWGRTVVDFNRAYNPPCALSPFATCPLPPMQNRLPLAIEAGEMAPAGSVELPAPPPVDG